MYSDVIELGRATHLLVHGQDGNIEIVELINMANRIQLQDNRSNNIVSESFVKAESLLVRMTC